MTPEQTSDELEQEKYRILSAAPLTATFLKGNPDRPEWAFSVFNETDCIVQNINSLVGNLDTGGFVGMSRDQGHVILAMGFELANRHDTELFQEEITKRVIEIGWIRPEELAKISTKFQPEAIVWTYLISGNFYRGCFDPTVVNR